MFGRVLESSPRRFVAGRVDPNAANQVAQAEAAAAASKRARQAQETASCSTRRALLTPLVKSRHAIAVLSALKSSLFAATGGKGA